MAGGSFNQKYRGNPNQQLYTDVMWNRAENNTQRLRYKGMPTYIAQTANNFALGNVAESYEIRNTDDGLQELTVVATNTDALPQWELLGNELNNAIETHPRFQNVKDYLAARARDIAASPTGNFDQDIGLLKEPVNNITLYPVAFYGAQNSAARNAIFEDAKLLMALYQNGTTEYIENQYVLRRTFIVGAQYSTKIQYSNLNRLYTTAEVNQEMNASGTPIPTTLAFSINNIKIEDVTTKINDQDSQANKYDYIPRWLKKRPTVTSQGGGPHGLRFQIDQEFWFYNWNRRIYLPINAGDKNPADAGEAWMVS